MGAGVAAAIVAVPVLVIISSLFKPTQDIWGHLLENVLPRIFVNTVSLVIGVSFGTLILGVALGWLTGACDFRGRRIFSWALLLPLAIPTYVMAFVYLGLFDFAGPLQSALGDMFPRSNLRLPNIQSATGVIIVMTLALYPYVYLLARSAFMTQGLTSIEAARSLGASPVGAFFRVVLPMARPWIVGGLMLVVMETLADFGAVSIFNFDTFTTAIYKSWFGFFSLTAAAQLSSILVFMVLVVALLEQRLRRQQRYTGGGGSTPSMARIQLSGVKAWAAVVFCLLVLLTAFAVPCLQLIVWSADSFGMEFGTRYLGLVGRTLFLALAAALITCSTALLLAYARRYHPEPFTFGLTRVATIGYALPGTVLAVGIFIPVVFTDNFISQIVRSVFGYDLKPLLQGTVFIMLIAYLVRFTAAGFNSVDSAMQRIAPGIDDASTLLGAKGLALLRRVHLPILKSGILTGLTLVFVDVMKEMPITLMTRPFGWDTLAVKIFEFTSEGEWERAALPAVAIILTGLFPVILLTRHNEKQFAT